MTFDEILDKLPYELAARLESDPFFTCIPIVVADKGNVAREYQQKQAVITEKSGKRGAAVFVLQLLGDDIYPGLPGAPLKLRPSIQVIENRELNEDESGTQKSVRKICRHIIKCLKVLNIEGLVQGLTCDNPAFEPVPLGEEFGEGTLSYRVNFVCQEASGEQISYCQVPTCTQVANTLAVALATGTGGAAIWYTTDDSYPYPGDQNSFPDSTSQQYGAPIAVQADTPLIIRACSYLDGYVASSIARWTVIISD